MTDETGVSSSLGDLQRQWKVATAAVTGVALIALLLFHQTVASLVEIWARSETFTHGFLVAPISLWLIWRIRHELARMVPTPHPWTFLLLAGACFAWLLGQLAAVGVVAQFALVTVLILTVPAILGWQVAWRMAFPLLFLYFAVPFGEFAMPQLMAWTAKVTVIGLRLSGIPVYVEGLQFVIPSGNWSVVEACSGVRYILASMTVGTLFAYLNYVSLKRRAAFIAVSLIVPIIANWLRAYMIVMLGHLSGNKLATGVDHLIYGWVFFGVVILLMFIVGGRWSDITATSNTPVPAITPQPVQRSWFGSPWLIAGVTVVMLALAPIAEWGLKARAQHEEPAFPAVLDLDSGWKEQGAGVSPAWHPDYVNPSVETNRVYAAGSQTVGLYLAYYRQQDYSRKLVSSENVLVRSNDPVWAKVASGQAEMTFGGLPVTARTAELRSGSVQNELARIVVREFYWIDGHLTASGAKAKLLTALALLRGHGDDSAVVILYAPKGQIGGGDAAIAAFAEVNSGRILAMLQAMRAVR